MGAHGERAERALSVLCQAMTVAARAPTTRKEVLVAMVAVAWIKVMALPRAGRRLTGRR
jgi:uncharacterized membrane protein